MAMVITAFNHAGDITDVIHTDYTLSTIAGEYVKHLVAVGGLDVSRVMVEVSW